MWTFATIYQTSLFLLLIFFYKLMKLIKLKILKYFVKNWYIFYLIWKFYNSFIMFSISPRITYFRIIYSK